MPRTNIDDAVSLFPFLSILAAVIGILVLMITAITLGQIGQDAAPPTADAVAAAQAAEDAKVRAEEYKRLRAQSKADLEASRDLQARLSQVADVQQNAATMAANVASVKQEIADLQAALDNSQETARQRAAELADKTARLGKLERETKQLDERLKPLLEQLAALQQELARRKTPPEEAQVQIKPSGSGANLAPTFVECAAGSIVLHDRAPPLRIPNAQMAGSVEFLELLDKVKANPQGTVVFLVRPDGVGTYNAARNVARGRATTNGKLAIGSQGKLDLSLFSTK